MKKQIGAIYLKQQRAKSLPTEVVCIQHIKRESKLKRLPSGAVKRIQ